MKREHLDMLCVREAYEQIYIPASPDLAPRTHVKYRHLANRWERHTRNPMIGELDTEDFVRYRNALKDLSAFTVEHDISDVLTLLRYCKAEKIISEVPSPGRRRKRRVQLKDTPTLGELGRLYEMVDVIEWPVQRWRSRSSGIAPSTPQWWRSLLCTLLLTAFRRQDALTLKWSEILDDRIRRVMAKVGTRIEIPIHPVLRRHLDALPRVDDFVFGHYTSNVQVNLWQKRLWESAGTQPITFQSIRRLSGQVWERSRARAGTCILGHSLRGSDANYLSPYEVLQSAMPHVEIPEAMREPNVKRATRDEVLKALRELDRADVLGVLQDGMKILAGNGVPA